MILIFLIAISFALMSQMIVDECIYETKKICCRYYAAEIYVGDAEGLFDLKASASFGSSLEAIM